LGTVIRDTQIRVTKNAKEHTNYNHQGLGRKFRLARPHQGLGRKFRLARPHRAPGTSSDSPDPAGPRTQVPTRPTPQGLGRKFRLARPHQGLGRKFRLARPHRASDASSDSPDPSGPRTPVPTRPILSRLGRRTPLHLVNKISPDVTDATAPMTRQGKATTVSTAPINVALPLSLYILTPVHCSTLPHSRKGMGEVKRHHCLWSFPTIDRICSSDR
jgi:hypothetical protein